MHRANARTSMNAPEPKLQDDPHIGRYERSTGNTAEGWRVTLSARPQMYRMEHGRGDARANIDTVVDLETLKSKLQKWHREGFFRPGDPALMPLPTAGRAGFLKELRRTTLSQTPQAAHKATAVIGGVRNPVKPARPPVPPLKSPHPFPQSLCD